MPSINPSSFEKDQLTRLNSEPATVEEIIDALYELAPDYLAEAGIALFHDIDRPRPSEFPSIRAFGEWQQDNPKELPLVEKRWQELLGIGSTNNFYIWFIQSEDKQVYNIDNTDSQTIKPALAYLVNLKSQDPEFFEACQEAATAQVFHMRQDINREGATRTQQEQEQYTLNNVVAGWICEMYMAEATTRLAQAGATQEEISSLYS